MGNREVLIFLLVNHHLIRYYIGAQAVKGHLHADCVIFLATADGTRYAITIHDMTKFVKANAGPVEMGHDAVKFAAYQSELYRLFEGKAPVIKEGNVNNEMDLKQLLQSLAIANAGLTVFEFNSNFTTFNKVELSQPPTSNIVTNTINRIPCP